jgi:hypothetical protein
MDPFLEHPDNFSDFHDRFIAYLSESLQALLPPPYVAPLGRRAWIEVSERYIGPDVQVTRPRNAPLGSGPSAAVAAPPRSRPLVIHIPHDQRSETFVEIYRGPRSERRLVTSIELLSLTNKTPGEHGRDLYLRKQREILDSKVHLVEIDLLRDGEHTTAVPLGRLREAADEFEYHVSIHHFDNMEDYFVYPIRLTEALPEIAIPLLPGDPAVTLDLQAVLNRTYDAGPYRREIDYRQDAPLPPLGPAWQSWLQERLASS